MGPLLGDRKAPLSRGPEGEGWFGSASCWAGAARRPGGRWVGQSGVSGPTRSCQALPQSQRAVLQLKGRVSELEAELAEQQHLRQQAADESEFLRAELDELKKKREDTEKAQRSLTEIESEGCRAGGWRRPS